MTSQPGKQTFAVHILPDISKSKGNQTVKFGQLLECNIINVFLEKSCTKCVGETIPRSFFKELKLSLSLDQQSEVSYSLFLLYVKVEDYKNIFKQRGGPLGFTSFKVI